MKDLKKYVLMVGLGLFSLVQAKAPVPLTTVDGKQVCPAGYTYTWPTPAEIKADTNAQPFCKSGGSAEGDSAFSYRAAQLNGADQSQLTKKLLIQVSSVDDVSPEVKLGTPSSVVKKTKALFKDASQARSILNEFRTGLVTMLDRLTAMGLQKGKFDKTMQSQLSQIQAKITQWNSDVNGSKDILPIYMCTTYSA